MHSELEEHRPLLALGDCQRIDKTQDGALTQERGQGRVLPQKGDIRDGCLSQILAAHLLVDFHTVNSRYSL